MQQNQKKKKNWQCEFCWGNETYTHYTLFCACMPTYFNLRNATKGHSDSEVRQI